MNSSVITYVSGGRLGDFIHQLSIISENYKKTGKKGVLYISNRGDAFSVDLKETYDALYEIIISQDYIESFHIHCDEKFDVNLSQWRCHRKLETQDLITTFKEIYSIDFGNKWLYINEKDEKWKDIIVINTTSRRFPGNFEKIRNDMASNKYIYVAAIEDEYTYFKNRTNIHDINYYKPTSLYELFIIINSCKLFIGSLSAPLSIATALNVPCYYTYCCPLEAIIFNLHNKIPNVYAFQEYLRH